MVEIRLRNRSGELPSLVRDALRKKASRQSPMYAGGPKRIYFYEWSDLTRCPLQIQGVDAFMSFLEHNRIECPAYMKGIMGRMDVVYAVCRTDGELLVSSTMEGLVMQFKEDYLPF